MVTHAIESLAHVHAVVTIHISSSINARHFFNVHVMGLLKPTVLMQVDTMK